MTLHSMTACSVSKMVLTSWDGWERLAVGEVKGCMHIVLISQAEASQLSASYVFHIYRKAML
jgi:hypothetical protein